MICFNMQLDEHFSKPMKEFVSLCLKKNPAEVNLLLLFLEVKAGALLFQLEITRIKGNRTNCTSLS